MGTSFDDRAKAAAERGSGTSGYSRRQIIQRGALVVGTAWTAPMLLSATPAWAGASTCTGTTPIYSICGPGPAFKCCPTGQACVLDTKGNYVCDVPLGGLCTNRGVGQCDGGFSRCNHLADPSICGGAGAVCDFNNNAVCVDTSPCFPGPGVTNARCGGPGAPCTTSTQCANGSTHQLPDLTCYHNVCTDCTQVGTCP